MTEADDAQLGIELRDAAIEQAYRAALEAWKEAARDAIREVARHRAHFTTDAVWTLLDHWDVERVREPRAIAGVLRAAVADGEIEATGELRNSVLPRGHRRRVMVYRSRLYENPLLRTEATG